MLIQVIAALFVLGCSSLERTPHIPLPDVDAEQVTIHPCLDTSSDLWNCGSCGNSCSTERADSCSTGICSCGTGPTCSEGFGCRFGSCHPSDPTGSVCEFDDACVAGHACIEGRCSFVRCVPEVCDGRDNDCDGITDGNSSGGPLSEWCYDNGTDPSIPLVWPCSPGVRVCAHGGWTECVGSFSPVPEQGLLRCDGEDNDCDGCIDGVVRDGVCVGSAPGDFDIVYAIDTSGSMSGTIAYVKSATDMFSAGLPAGSRFRFGLVYFEDPIPVLVQDITDFATFQTVLNTTMPPASGGSEPSRDVIYTLGTGELAITWRPGSIRIIIMFTDEQPQSYRIPLVDEPIMCSGLIHGEYVAVVTASRFFGEYDECATEFSITNTVEGMVSDLETIITDHCL